MMSTLAVVLVAAFSADGLTTGPMETVGEGFQFTEGPLWLPSGEWIFSDIPADTIFKADKTVFRNPSGKSNGLTLDPQGRLIACEHGNRRVTRTEAGGVVTVLADSYMGKKLNSPNDACVRADGTVYFTDPQYGLEGREPEVGVNGVYMISPGGDLTRALDDFNAPNGIVLSPDEKLLYVADTNKSHIRAFDVAADGTLGKGRVWCSVSFPDGIRVDTLGRVWATSSNGVAVYGTDGKLIETLKFPQAPANCAFGGADGKTLYVTARTGVYSVTVTASGIHPASRVAR